MVCMESSGEHVQQLKLVDINQSTVKETWPLLLAAVERAHFISLDLELSGLGLHLTRKAFVCDEKYKLLREVASSYAIVSMGVACFQWQPEDTSSGPISCEVEVFNIWLLSQQPYTMDPSSAKFLLKHGFDFNKQLRYGLPYSSVGVASGVKEHHHLVELFQHLLLSPTPLVVHNGWVDLLFLYHACHAPLPPTRDSLIADLAEMFERGGVYDTKAIANYQCSEKRTFLEYIYKKALVRNQRSRGVWLQLVFANYPTLHCSVTEEVVLPQIPNMLGSELMSIDICSNVLRYGSCDTVDCGRGHSLTIAVLQEEHSNEMQRLKRKRKREQNKGRGCENTSPLGTPSPLDHPQLSELFKHELAAAKANLSSCDSMKQSHDSVKESHDTDRSCGHRAGFDAFMTGFTFACFALNSCKHLNTCSTPTQSQAHPHTSTPPTEEQQIISQQHCKASPLPPSLLLEGLADMRNCLSNRSQATPVRIAHSQFSKCSDDHKVVWERITSTQQQ